MLRFRNRVSGIWLLASVVAGCTRNPVKWGEIGYSPPGAATSESAPISLPDSSSPVSVPDSAACRTSIRLARAGKSFYAVWWSIRPDSSARLESSRSDGGGPWTKPVVADISDGSGRGCARPAPSIGTDLINGYLHLAYFIEPSSGAGVFSIHSMDRDSSFHSPVAMVYGARPSATSIAAEGDRVAVAYEDPNSSRPRIFVALSKTMGHIFELRLPVSDESAAATDPVIKVRGTKLEVSWTEHSPADSTRERQASRTGIWR